MNSGVCERCGKAFEDRLIPNINACGLCAQWWCRNPGLFWITSEGWAT